MTPIVYPEQVLGYLVLAAVVALATHDWFFVPAIRLGHAGGAREAARPRSDHRTAEAQRSAPARARRHADLDHRRQRRMAVAVVGNPSGLGAASRHGRRRHRHTAA